MIRQIGNRLFQFKKTPITFLSKYSKGHKSFMTLDNNIKAISFQEFQESLEIKDQDFAEKFKKDENSSLFELKDGFAKIILDNYNTQINQVEINKKLKLQKDNHFQIFYNLIQIVERDITLLVANEHFREQQAQEIKQIPQTFQNLIVSDHNGANVLILNAGSGVKAIRFSQELDPSYLQNITVVEKSANFPNYFKLMSEYNKIDHSKIKGKQNK